MKYTITLKAKPISIGTCQIAFNLLEPDAIAEGIGQCFTVFGDDPVTLVIEFDSELVKQRLQERVAAAHQELANVDKELAKLAQLKGDK